MKIYGPADVPRLACITFEAYESAKDGIFVWWDVPNGEFLVLNYRAAMAQMVLNLMDGELAQGYVGIFKQPEFKFHEIRDAIQAHIDGKLRT